MDLESPNICDRYFVPAKAAVPLHYEMHDLDSTWFARATLAGVTGKNIMPNTLRQADQLPEYRPRGT